MSSTQKPTLWFTTSAMVQLQRGGVEQAAAARERQERQVGHARAQGRGAAERQGHERRRRLLRRIVQGLQREQVRIVLVNFLLIVGVNKWKR